MDKKAELKKLEGELKMYDGIMRDFANQLVDGDGVEIDMERSLCAVAKMIVRKQREIKALEESMR